MNEQHDGTVQTIIPSTLWKAASQNTQNVKDYGFCDNGIRHIEGIVQAMASLFKEAKNAPQ